MPSYVPRLHPALEPYVDSCVGFDYRLDPDAVHHGKPSPAVTVVFAFDEPLDCGMGGSETALWWTLVGGLHLGPAVIRTHGFQRGIQLGLTPAGCRAILGLPAAPLAGTIADAAALGAGLPETLHTRLADLGWMERFAVLERHLLARAGAGPSLGPAAEVGEAWRLIVASGGRARIADVARHVGWSRRHLQDRFVAEYGLAPKQVARIARFDRARGLAESGRPLAEVAAVAGFADQAHLSREWRALADQTPTESLVDFPTTTAEPA